MYSGSFRARLNRVFDIAHRATVLLLIGSSVAVIGIIGANILQHRRMRLEKLAEHEAKSNHDSSAAH